MQKYLKAENLIYLTIIALPAYLLRFTVFGAPTNVLEVLMGAVIIICLVETRHCLVSTKAFHKEYIIPISLIFLGFLVSIFINKNYAVGLGIVKSWFVIPLLFSLAANKIIKPESRKNIFFSLFVSGFLVASTALVYKILGVVTYDGRLEGFFNSPNYLAMYLSPGIIAGTVWFSRMQKSKVKMQNCNSEYKIKKYLLLLPMWGALYFTYSYATWVTVAIALIVVLILNKKLNAKYLIFSSLMAVVLIFLLKDTSKFNDLINFNARSSLASRMMIWQSAGKILSDHWFWGIGPGNFQTKYLEYQKYFPPYLEWAVPHPHSLYLAFWLYGGLLSFVGFLTLIFHFFWRILSVFMKLARVETSPPAGGLTSTTYLMSFGIMIYILLHGLVDTTYFKNDLAVVFWLVYFLKIKNPAP